MKRKGSQVGAMIVLVLMLFLVWKYHQPVGAFISGFLLGLQSS